MPEIRTGLTFQSGEIMSGYFECLPCGIYPDLVDGFLVHDTERRSRLLHKGREAGGIQVPVKRACLSTQIPDLTLLVVANRCNPRFRGD